MCLIIYKPEGAVVPTQHINNSIEVNSDGVGIMWVADGRIKVAKKLGTKEELKEFSANTIASITGSYVMHHRMATDGLTNEDNCHPFKVLSIDDGDAIDLYMAHNGMISECKTSRQAERSDTRVYVEDFLRPILKVNPALLEIPEFRAHLKGFVGSGSKLTFMDNSGKVTIVNESAGIWKDTNVPADSNEEAVKYWLSNQYSIAERQAVTTYYGHYNHSQNKPPVTVATDAKVCDINTPVEKKTPQQPYWNYSTPRTHGGTSSGRLGAQAVATRPLAVKAMDEYLEYGTLGMTDVELAEHLVTIEPSIAQIREIISELDEYTVASVIAELLDRISTRYYG